MVWATNSNGGTHVCLVSYVVVGWRYEILQFCWRTDLVNNVNCFGWNLVRLMCGVDMSVCGTVPRVYNEVMYIPDVCCPHLMPLPNMLDAVQCALPVKRRDVCF
jgi:hypothetical protein